MKKIIIAGGSGLIGQKLIRVLLSRGYKLTILSGRPKRAVKIFAGKLNVRGWNVNQPFDTRHTDWAKEIEGAFAVVNLAGENLAGARWTANKKKKIIDSRINSTRLLQRAIEEAENKPEVYVGASAVGFYGNTKDELVDETSPLGSGFLAEVVKQWEDAQAEIDRLKIRRVSIRTGVALSADGGALAKMIVPFKLFAGGPLGKGNQYLSWIHINDIANVYAETLENESYIGAINACVPEAVTMNGLAETIGRVMKRPSVFRVPEVILKTVLGEAADMVLHSSRVYPSALIKNNFDFSFTDLQTALENLLKNN